MPGPRPIVTVEPTVVDEDERIDRERLRRELEIDGFEQGMQG